MSLYLDSNFSEFNFKVDKSRNNKVYRFEGFRLDASHFMLYRGDSEISLPPKAVETLFVLVEHAGDIVGKDDLMSRIWTDSIVEESNLAHYLHVLRKTLGNKNDGQPFIETLRRRGYRFNCTVEVENSPTPLAENNGDHIKRTQPVEDDVVVDRKSHSTSARRELRVERHGNVLAVADWQEPETEPQPVASPAYALPASGSDIRLPRKNRYIATIVISLVVVGAFTYLLFRSQSNSAQTAAKDDVVVVDLTDGEDVNEATISPDGNYFVYASHDGQKAHLWVKQTGQASRLEIVEPFAGQIYSTSFMPDSQTVYFAVAESGKEQWDLYRVPTLGGTRTKVLENVPTPVSFSPDGNEMVFMRAESKSGGTSMVIASSDGKHERTLLTRTRSDAEGMSGGGAWSPDGRSIAYGKVNMQTPWTGSCTIAAIDPQSGETRSLSTETWDNCYRMAWTRDGQGLVFIGTRSNEAFSTRRDQVYYLSIADGRSRRITTDGNRNLYSSLGVTDSDEIFAVPQNRLSQIWSIDASGDARTAVQITKGFADGRGGIAPLADGRIAYVTRNGDGFSVFLMNGDGSARKQLATDPPEMQEVRSSPDGVFFVFSAKRDGWDHLYRVNADGGDLKQLTFGESLEVDSSVSPDANWIIYNSIAYKGNDRRSALWKIPADGGEPAIVADVDCHWPHLSPNGKFVSCVTPDFKQILVISSENGQITQSFKPAENSLLDVGARWTPDGKALAYITKDENTGNLTLQALDGDTPRALTDFASGDIYNFAFSADGTKLYLARGYQTKKAILIKNFR